MPRRIVTVALVAALAALVLSPAAAESAGSLAHRVATALRTARHADRDATLALRRTMTAGPAGVGGATGQAGTQGAPGLSAKGDAGATGTAGQDGATGATGPAAALTAHSVTNDAGVFLGTSDTTVLRMPVTGRVLAVANLQVNGEQAADSALCQLRADGAVVADEFAPLAVGDQRTLALSTVADVASELSVTCRRGVVASSVEVPLQRATLSVVGG